MVNHPNGYQIRFWQEIVQLRVHIFYLEQYHISAERYEKWINIFLAIVSNGSIAAWAIWQKYPFAWALLIGLSQVFNAIRPYLPFQVRSKTISKINLELKDLALHAERKWYAVSEGLLTSEQIHEETMDIKERKSKMESTFFGSSPLPHKDAFLKNAEDQAKVYFRSNYNV